MKKKSLVFTVVLILSLCLGIFAVQSGQDLFQKALTKERAEGNLEEAIVLYEKVITESQDKTLKAQAQLRIGMCYEKLGQKSLKLAQEAFQKVIDNYPAQSEEVKIAREKLSVFTKAQAVMIKPNTDFITRKIAELRSDVYMGQGTVSPNGRYFPYVNWEKGNIAVFDLITGEYRDLTNDGNWGEGTSQFADFHRWSPDSKQLAYAWLKGDVNELRIVDIEDSHTRILWTAKDFFGPEHWLADGQYILGNFTTGENRDDPTGVLKSEENIAMMSVSDGSIRILKNLGNKPTMGLWMDLSPDGRFVAYDLNQGVAKSIVELATSKKDIHLYAMDGSLDLTLVDHPANDYMPMWTPAGNHIVFLSDRTGRQGLYSLEVMNGSPHGEPELIKDINGGHLGFAENGALYYYVNISKWDVYTADINPQTGKIITTPQIISRSYEGSSFSPGWSGDGKYMAYYAERENGPVVLVIRNGESGEERNLNLGNNPIRSARFPKWSPDGKWLSFIGDIDEQGQGVYRINAQTGDITPVFIPDQGTIDRHIWSPDLEVLYLLKSNGSGFNSYYSILSREMVTGNETILFKGELRQSIGPFALSPDGSKLAYRVAKQVDRDNSNETIFVVPSTGGEAREVLNETMEDSRAIAGLVNLNWSPDGDWLYYGRQNYPDSMISFHRVSAEGGKSQELKVFEEGMSGICLHPDGKQIAFTIEKSRQEIWAMENFLPKTTDKK
ncbi:tetratricopeptide repeat protein [Acidobacteriota bacterium]